MANKASSASQAIKDMLENGIDISMFIGVVNKIHNLNAVIGIVTKEKATKKAKRPKYIKVTEAEIKITMTAKVKVNKNFIINPDGTISFSNTDWDFK